MGEMIKYVPSVCFRGAPAQQWVGVFSVVLVFGLESSDNEYIPYNTNEHTAERNKKRKHINPFYNND